MSRSLSREDQRWRKTAARAFGSSSKARSFGLRAQFSRCAHVPPERTIGAHGGRGARSQLFSRQISSSLKCIHPQTLDRLGRGNSRRGDKSSAKLPRAQVSDFGQMLNGQRIGQVLAREVEHALNAI